MKIAWLLAALLALVPTEVHAQSAAPMPSPTLSYTAGEMARVTGPIVSKRGDDVIVQDETTKTLSLVTLTQATKISRPAGFLKLDRKFYDADDLIPGLVIVVKGMGGARGNLVADNVSFHKSSMRTAIQINAGEVELRAAERRTNALARANRDSITAVTKRARDSVKSINRRINTLESYDVRSSTAIAFSPGSAALTGDARLALDTVAAQVRGLDNYLIQIAGFADATGTARENDRLSAARARAVMDYLEKAHAVDARRFAPPTALGEADPAATNATATGRAMNRRVEVRILINRGELETKP